MKGAFQCFYFVPAFAAISLLCCCLLLLCRLTSQRSNPDGSTSCDEKGCPRVLQQTPEKNSEADHLPSPWSQINLMVQYNSSCGRGNNPHIQGGEIALFLISRSYTHGSNNTSNENAEGGHAGNATGDRNVRGWFPRST